MFACNRSQSDREGLSACTASYRAHSLCPLGTQHTTPPFNGAVNWTGGQAGRQAALCLITEPVSFVSISSKQGTSTFN